MLAKRLRQLWAVVSHPSSLLSKYDTPWDNVIYKDIRMMYATNHIRRCLFEDLPSRMAIPARPTACEIRHLYDTHSAGSISPFELKVIANLCRLLAPKTILEIGTFEGRTTLNMAINCPDSTVYSICLPQRLCSFQVGKYFAGTRESDRIVQIHANTRDFDFSTLPVMDLIFIDGDHSFEGVHNDSRRAFNLVSKRGVVLWHDFDMCHLGTTKAALESIERAHFTYAAIDGTSLAIAFRTETTDTEAT